MTKRSEKETGQLDTGEMMAWRFAEEIGVPHGTIKRWLHDGMPADRSRSDRHTWIDPVAAKAWIAERFKGRKTVAFQRRGFVYFVEREDGAIKIGWSSDVMRRVFEIRKNSNSSALLLACFPGDKPDELRMHDLFKESRIEDEWFRPDPNLMSFINSMKGRAA